MQTTNRANRIGAGCPSRVDHSVQPTEAGNDLFDRRAQLVFSRRVGVDAQQLCALRLDFEKRSNLASNLVRNGARLDTRLPALTWWNAGSSDNRQPGSIQTAQVFSQRQPNPAKTA